MNMEKKMVIVPFDVELAKKITEKSVEGRVITEDGRPVKIVYFSDVETNSYNVLYVVNAGEDGECSYWAERNGSSEEETADLMLEIPEYLTYKDGDVIFLDESKIVLIVKSSPYKNEIGTIYSDCYVVLVNGYLYVESNVIINKSRLATEVEKQKLINALESSRDPKFKEYLKRFFNIEVKPECEFNPKDWVLCKSSHWCLCQFSHKTIRFDGVVMYVTVGGIAYEQCIPYNNQTAHLLGTDKDLEEEK